MVCFIAFSSEWKVTDNSIFFFLNYLQSQQMLPQAEFNFVRLCVSKWEKKNQEETQECSSKWEG